VRKRTYSGSSTGASGGDRVHELKVARARYQETVVKGLGGLWAGLPA
jgi:hypothetical protein